MLALDEEHLVNAVRHVPLNPVRARLVERAADWPWSSRHAHLKRGDDAVTTVAPVLERIGDFAALVDAHADHPTCRIATGGAGRPIGGEAWLEDMETRTGRAHKSARRGP